MSFTVRCILIIISLYLFWMIWRDMVNKQISEKVGLMWMLFSTAILLSGIFPDLAIWFSSLFGIAYAPAAILAVATVIILLILYKNHKTVSVLNMKVQELAMQVSLLNQENEHMIQKMKELGK